MTNYLKKEDIPDILRKFLIHTQTIENKSLKTVQEYYLDLKLYLRFIKKLHKNINSDIDLIDITDLNIENIKQITLGDTYEFLAYLATERKIFHKSENSKLGISASSRARKISSIRAFFKFLTDKIHLIDVNPVQDLSLPKKSKTLPKYMNLDESMNLLNSIEGTFKERDMCIIVLFLTCGIRVSELASIDLTDIKDNKLTVHGKGDKERTVYLSDLCLELIEIYKNVRIEPYENDKNALFISRQKNRINVQTIKALVKKHSSSPLVNRSDISAHKLRHTAATLMYSNGLDIRALQEVLGHKNIDTTMIYTHIDNSNLQLAVDINPISNIKIKKTK